MRYGGRKSFFWSAARRLGEHVCQKQRREDSALYAQLERRFQNGVFGALCGDGYDRMGWQFRLRRKGMQWREESLFLSLWRRLCNYVAQSSVGYVGLLLLTVGISFLILTLIVDEFLKDRAQLFTSLSLVFLSVPLLGSQRSLSSVMGESFFVGWIQKSIGSPPVPQKEEIRGEGRPMAVLGLCALLVTAAGFFSPARTVLGVLFLFLGLLLLPVPEVDIPILLFLFPFFQLTSHPTLLLLALTLILEISWLLKIYCGRRDFELELADLFVLLFSFLLFCGGLVGYGELETGAMLSLLALVYFPVKNLLSSKAWRIRVQSAICTGGTVCALFGIFEYFFGELELLWVDSERFFDIGGRVCAFFDNPNILAVYLLFVFPIALVASLDPQKAPVRRFFFALCSFSILLCIVLTWSRGAWLGVLCEIFLVLLFQSPGSAAVLFLGFPLSLGALPFLPQSVIGRFLSIGDLAESSIRYRIYTWQGVLETVKAHPFGIGVGEAAFSKVYPHYAKSGIETVMHAHNLLLQITLELGVVGTAVFLFLLALAWIKGFGRGRSMGAPYALCGVMVMGFFDHVWYAPGMLALVFAFIALSLTGEEKE